MEIHDLPCRFPRIQGSTRRIGALAWIFLVLLACFWAEKPQSLGSENGGLSGAVRRESGMSGGVRLEGVDFYRKPDAEARFLEIRAARRKENQGEFTPEESARLAMEAYQNAFLEEKFSYWLYHNGPHPRVFRAKAHLYNPTDEAFLNLRLKVVHRAKVGQLLVNPGWLLTDYDHLVKTGQWRTLETYEVKVDVIAPGEEMLVPLHPFEMDRLVRPNVYEWPELLQTEATLEGGGPPQKMFATLRTVPDHFVVPDALLP